MPSELARTDPVAEPALGVSRARVLSVLQNSPAPLGVDEVAERVHLHVNTTRFHLDALVGAGLAQRATETRNQPGRPRTLYAARPDAPRTGERSYRLLAQILASYFAAEVPQPSQAAQRAGQVWGGYLAERPAPFEKIDVESASRQLVDVLDGIGFAPEAKTSGRKRQLLLRHCPFREAAEQHTNVVCAVHLGLMQGLLAGIGAPLEAERLKPFVEPDLCIADLTVRPDRARAARRRRQ